MESRINGTVCFAFILTLSLIQLDRGTALWRTPTMAADNTPLLTWHPPPAALSSKPSRLLIDTGQAR